MTSPPRNSSDTALATGSKRKIANRMAPAVVDGLEVIEVEHEERGRRPVAAGAEQHALRLRFKAAAVQNAGQRIDQRGLAML